MAKGKKISLTSEEAVERFGGALVQFSSYYKYSFVFGVEIEGKRFSDQFRWKPYSMFKTRMKIPHKRSKTLK